MNEATITVNGVTLSTAESMTIRVALDHFGIELSVPNYLGTGAGEDIRKGSVGWTRCSRSLESKVPRWDNRFENGLHPDGCGVRILCSPHESPVETILAG